MVPEGSSTNWVPSSRGAPLASTPSASTAHEPAGIAGSDADTVATPSASVSRVDQRVGLPSSSSVVGVAAPALAGSYAQRL